MISKHFGSCLCGTVKYEILGDFESFFLCHCKYCQKDTGSAHAANLFSKSAQLKWLTGKENSTMFNLPKTRHIKSFCKSCGSALPNLQMNDTLLVVPAGSLDSDLYKTPDAHIFVSSQSAWSKELKAITKHDRYPT